MPPYMKTAKKKNILKRIATVQNVLTKNQIGKISLHQSEIESRLRDIPVFTLADHNSSFSLISGHSNDICLFFMNKTTAEKYQKFVMQENPVVAKNARIVKLGLDQFYKCACKPNKNIACRAPEKVLFRIVPDPSEIDNALQIIGSQRTIESMSDFVIDGVPLYQIRSLKVKFANGTMRATPLFLSKEDAEVSLSRARHKEKFQTDTRKQEALIKAEKAVEKAKIALESFQDHTPTNTTSNIEITKKYQRHLSDAEDRLALLRLPEKESLSNYNHALIEVGSLEWVIQQMEQDRMGSWSEVIFIPPNYFNSKAFTDLS